jgi:hypothetical protein
MVIQREYHSICQDLVWLPLFHKKIFPYFHHLPSIHIRNQKPTGLVRMKFPSEKSRLKLNMSRMCRLHSHQYFQYFPELVVSFDTKLVEFSVNSIKEALEHFI